MVYYFPTDDTEIGKYLKEHNIKYIHATLGPKGTEDGAAKQIVELMESFERNPEAFEVINIDDLDPKDDF